MRYKHRVQTLALIVVIASLGLVATKTFCRPGIACAKESHTQKRLTFISAVNHLPTQRNFTTLENAKQTAATGPTVLFFKANWCGTCTDAQFDLNKNISTLPSNTTILTVDYDQERSLKTTYGITTQHTWVIIDATGTALDTWVGGATAELNAHISALL